MGVLGYILIFYIGFYFYRLAENYKKNKWLYGFIGILFFFVGLFGYVFFRVLNNTDGINEFNFASISIKSTISGVVIAIIMFHVLDFLWKKNKKTE